MKLASYKDGSRDGQLVVVARDLSTAHYATGIASRLQQALDDWNFIAPQLQDLYVTLNAGKARHAFPFDPALCLAPLPRAGQWVRGGAYPGDLVPAPPAVPVMTRGASDELLGPCAPIRVADEAFGIDFQAGLAVLTGDVPQAAAPEQALDAVRLLLLVNDVALRQPPGGDALHAAPATAFGPVAITPDELGEAWQHGRIQLTLQVDWNGRKVGRCDAGADMAFDFGALIAYAARTRRLRAGSLIGSGPLRNAGTGQGSQRAWPRGYASIADRRGMETLLDGAPQTDFMRWGDRVRIEMKGKDGESLFGAIDQQVQPFGG